jgi:hypothetical protein
MTTPNPSKPSTALLIGFWLPTSLIAIQMTLSGTSHFYLPAVAQIFVHLGFPAYFRIELGVAKLLGVAALMIPVVPARVKEWAYAGFTINLVSAFIAHVSVGDGIGQWISSVVILTLLVISYIFYRKLQSRASAA